MNIHEFQSKQLLKEFGVPVPRGMIARTPDEAVQGAQDLQGSLWVVKAQIHAGGRGLAGGVKLARSMDEVKTYAQALIGHTLVTHQTGPQGQKIKQVYIEEGCAFDKELYVSLVMDRATSMINIIASSQGGMDIEEVAAKTPEAIFQIAIDPVMGYQAFHGRKLAFALGFEGKLVNEAVALFGNLYKAFTELDAVLIEINPLAITKDGHLLALDGKMTFDDNALYRQKKVAELRDEDEEDPLEVEASKHSLNYIKLDGNIGCMVNGAGLAMATMDIIQLHGAAPANFLDVGGGATKERVSAGFKLILSDPNVEGILVNIFGGIMRCDIVADGIVAAAKELDLTIPLVVRLEGTNVDQGKRILEQSGLAIIPADHLQDAAQKIVNAVKEAR